MSDATTLPLDKLETAITEAVRAEYEEIDLTNPPEITETYINGSYGAGAAHEHSDIDVCIGLLNTDEVAAISRVEWHEFSVHLCDVLTPFDGWWEVDSMVMPRTTDFFQHIQERSRHGGYETVFDLSGREYRDVTEV